MAEDQMLVCVGNLTLDEAISPAGVRVEAVGGDALFAALAARFAGGLPRLLAPLSADAPEALLAAIRTSGTDPTVLPHRDQPTIRNVIRYQADGSRVWDLVLGEEHFEALSVHPNDFGDELVHARGVLLSAMAIDAQLELAGWLRDHTSATIYFDPQEDYVAGREAELLDAVRACDVFMPSEVEAVILAGTRDLASATRAFLDLGPALVVVKLAAAGCLVATREHPAPVRFSPPIVVEPTDSTGAGDAFCGAFAAVHLRTGHLHAAVQAGMGAARIAIGNHGISGLLEAVSTPTADVEEAVARR